MHLQQSDSGAESADQLNQVFGHRPDENRNPYFVLLSHYFEAFSRLLELNFVIACCSFHVSKMFPHCFHLQISHRMM